MVLRGSDGVVYPEGMMKRRLWWLVLALVLVLGLLGYMWWRLDRVSVVNEDELTGEEILRDVEYNTGDRTKPVVKLITGDEALTYDDEGNVQKPKGVIVDYNLRGILVEDMVMWEDGLLRGSFYIKDDPVKREMLLVAGSTEGKIYFGDVTYEADKYSGTWSLVDSKVAEKVLTEGSEIYIVLEYDASEETGYYRDQAEVLDGLWEDIRSGKDEYEVSEGFAVGSGKVGLVN